LLLVESQRRLAQAAKSTTNAAREKETSKNPQPRAHKKQKAVKVSAQWNHFSSSNTKDYVFPSLFHALHCIVKEGEGFVEDAQFDYGQ
jgi:hypothetical protein